MSPKWIRNSSSCLILLLGSIAGRDALADTDACSLITADQVSAIVKVPVGPGAHVTPTFVKTCTWTPTGSTKIRAVTLNLQAAATYDGAKRMALTMSGSSAKAAVKSASVGDDGYYYVAGELVTLTFRKKSAAAKVAVYAQMPADQVEAMELAIARQVAEKL